MKYLFLFAAVLIGYGSFYPFDFKTPGAPLRSLLDHGEMSRGDLLGNLALFLPFGYLGMVAWRRPRGPLRFLIVVAAAGIYGVALQWAQLYVPARDPALRDALPNLAGAALGALVGSIPIFDVRRPGARTGIRAVPWVILGFWFAYRLAPFVPSIDAQEWKDSVKPLLVWRPFPWINVLHDAAAWAAVACLWAAAPARGFTVRWLPVIAVATLCLEVPVVDNHLSPGNVLGAGIGLLLWAALSRLPGRHGVLALFLAAAIVLDGLEPFQPRKEIGSLQWIPFSGFLQGSMLLNALSLFEKVFLYGALVWLAREAGLRLLFAALGAALLLAGVEVAQTRFGGHTPEITDPILALLEAAFIGMADRPAGPPGNPVESPVEVRKEEI